MVPKIEFGTIPPLGQEGDCAKKLDFGTFLPLEQEGNCAKIDF